MARSRNIKPGFFTNDVLGGLSPLARLLFAGMWCHADRRGRLEDRPKRLKAEILPYDECDIEVLAQCLHDAKLVHRYVVDGKGYIQIIKFRKHQNPHIKEQESTIPAPDLPEFCMELAGLIPSSLIPDSLNPLPKAKKKRSPNGSRLQVESLPEDWFDYASKERPDLDPRSVFNNFRDWWTAKPGKDGMKLDWFATWRVWVRNQKAIGGGNGKGKFDPLAYSREQLRKSVAERMDAGITSEAIGSFPVEVHK